MNGVLSKEDKAEMHRQIELDPVGCSLVYGMGATWPDGHPRSEMYKEYAKIVRKTKENANV